jgi:flagellar basal-body rod protein FlgG
MIRALYTAASGMLSQQFNMDVLSNNLSNVNTTAFKGSTAEFQDLLYEHLRLPGTIDSGGQQLPMGLEVGHGVKAAASQLNFAAGSPTQTGNPLDMMIQGSGFFQVTMPDGTTAYTRDGNFSSDGNGSVVTTDGHPLDPPITIPSAATGIVVTATGEVQITLPSNQPNQVVGQIQIANFPNPAGLTSEGANLYNSTVASGQVQVNTPGQNGLGTIAQGFLEGSNVQVVTEMVNLITTQRAYEVNGKVVTACDTMLQEANNLRG